MGNGARVGASCIADRFGAHLKTKFSYTLASNTEREAHTLYAAVLLKLNKFMLTALKEISLIISCGAQQSPTLFQSSAENPCLID